MAPFLRAISTSFTSKIIRWLYIINEALIRLHRSEIYKNEEQENKVREFFQKTTKDKEILKILELLFNRDEKELEMIYTLFKDLTKILVEHNIEK